MENKTVLGILVVCLIASLLILGSMISNIEVEAQEVDLSGVVTAEQVNAIVQTHIAGITISEAEIEGETPREAFSGEYILTKNEFEEEAIEAEALRLATEYIESKDFKKEIKKAIVNENESGSDVESYKDITEVVILDLDVIKVGKKSIVSFDLKVYYFIEGDEDEVYKSRLDNIEITVKDLDFDAEFEDAEVKELKSSALSVRYIREL